MRIPIIILCLLLVVLPVSAMKDYTYTAASDKAITSFYLTCDVGTHATYTLVFADNNTASGSYYNEPSTTLLLMDANKAYIELGGVSDSRTNTPRSALIVYVEASSRILNTTQQLTITGGTYKDAPYIEAHKDGYNSALVSYSINADSEFSEPITTTDDLITIQKNLNGQISFGSNWITKIMDAGYKAFDSGLSFVYNLLYWLKFFFIDNLMLIIGLYLSVSMAFAARAARGNIGRFFRVFVNDQRKLFGFIMEVWRMLLESIGTIRGWFRI